MSSRTMKEPPHSSSAIFALPGPMPFGILRIHGSSTIKCEGKQAARRGARRRAGHGTDHGWAEEQGSRRSISCLCLLERAHQSAPHLSPLEPKFLAGGPECPNTGEKNSVTNAPLNSAVGLAPSSSLRRQIGNRYIFPTLVTRILRKYPSALFKSTR